MKVDKKALLGAAIVFTGIGLIVWFIFATLPPPGGYDESAWYLVGESSDSISVRRMLSEKECIEWVEKIKEKSDDLKPGVTATCLIGKDLVKIAKPKKP